MSFFFNYNGKIYPQHSLVLTPDNRSLKYGDGLFETLKMVKGNLQLKQYHFERLFAGLQTLLFDIPPGFTATFLENEIAALSKKNNHQKNARVRLMVFRNDADVSIEEINSLSYIIQTMDLAENDHMNEDGFIIDVYPDAKKSCDALANIKTNNFLPYVLAGIYAKTKNFNDCILLNNFDRICDSGIANIFIIKNKKIFTPPLTEGCIAGVMRRWIIEKIKLNRSTVIEMPLTIEDVQGADEVFLTNSIHPMRWVKQFRNAKFKNQQIKLLYTDLIKTF